MAVIYEWDIEELEEVPSAANDFDPDILGHNFCASFVEALDMYNTYGPEDKEAVRIVLVRDVGDDLEGLTDRAWAYIENGKLPDTFTYGAGEDSGIPVPKKFHKEVEKAMK